MRRQSRALSVLFLAAPACCAVSCDDDTKQQSTVRREGQPDYVRSNHEGTMGRAVAKAKETQGRLVAALANPKPEYHGFAVKKPFQTPDGSDEHIWVIQASWDGSAFHGVIDNEPVDTKAVKLGDRVSVRSEELSDWMYIDGKRVVGGYTLRALHFEQSPEEQRAFIEQSGLEIPAIDF